MRPPLPVGLRSRRDLLRLSAAGAAALVAGCAGGSTVAELGLDESAPDPTSPPGTSSASGATATPRVSPTATPQPVPPAGRTERLLLPDTASETPVYITHSGVRGPVVMVLGGVHGNEPGGWLAASEVASWQPKTGSLIVLPRANTQAMAEFVRTREDLGDLNRLYPGSLESSLPMERMAAEIVALGREFGAELLIDMHESWAFFAERTQSGTAFLGQTVTTGIGPRNPTLGRAIIQSSNATISGRDLLIERDGSAFRRDPSLGDPGPNPTNRGRSSLSLGGHVAGLTPLLVEMGQEGQPVERRTQLHLLVARAALDQLAM